MFNEKYFFRVKRCETNISPKNTKGAQHIVRVLCWIVFCVIEGFLGVIVRHVDHGGTSLTGYPGARVPAPLIRKTRRMLGQTRTLRRVALVRVNSLYPGCRRAYGTPTTRYVVGATLVPVMIEVLFVGPHAEMMTFRHTVSMGRRVGRRERGRLLPNSVGDEDINLAVPKRYPSRCS